MRIIFIQNIWWSSEILERKNYNKSSCLEISAITITFYYFLLLHWILYFCPARRPHSHFLLLLFSITLSGLRFMHCNTLKYPTCSNSRETANPVYYSISNGTFLVFFQLFYGTTSFVFPGCLTQNHFYLSPIKGGFDKTLMATFLKSARSGLETSKSFLHSLAVQVGGGETPARGSNRAPSSKGPSAIGETSPS